MTNKENQEDWEWLEKARAGDKQAFSHLMQKHKSVVAATVIGMLGSGEDAEDVGQNVFIRFYNSINDYRGDSALSTYLTRIAINLSLNEISKRKRKSSLFIRRRSNEQENHFEIADSRDEESAFEAREAVNKALQQLEPKFRAVVVLRMMQGYSTSETAKILKLPVGTVLSRLSRAQDKLKILLGNLLK